MKAMVAARHGGPETLEMRESSEPVPGDGEVLVRVEAAGVNFIDVYHRSGQYATAVPVPLGLEGAGVVETIGAGVTTTAPGARVAWAGVPGSYATHVLAPADKVVPVPDELGPREAAAAMLQGMTAHYLTHDSYALRAGDECLVHAAAGGVGLLLCQMAKRAGARVLATVSTEEKAAAARGAGADEVIFYRSQDFVAEVRRLTQRRGVRVVYDGVGRDTFEKGLDCLALRGSMILFGQSSGAAEPVDPLVLSAKGSLFLQRPTLFHHVVTRADLLERAGAVLGWVAEGGLQLRIAATFPLGRAADAHRALEGRGTIGKVLLEPRPGDREEGAA
ncbi:MAG: quinone oxidoreductase family protein [Thermoleophilia bacterium]